MEINLIDWKANFSKVYGSLKLHENNNLSEADIKALTSYLNNPVSCGLWRLNAEWKRDSGISNLIWNEISKEIDSSSVITFDSGKRERRIKITDQWKIDLKKNICEKISFIFILFSYLVDSETEEQDTIDSFSEIHEAVQLVLDLVSVDVIKDKYSEAYNYFKNEIWLLGADFQIRGERITKIKGGGFITIEGPSSSNGKISLVSWLGLPLKKLKNFLELIGKIKDSELMPVFSPEEEVFAPYFQVLESAYPYIVTQAHILPLFRKSINHFKDNNYSDCVSAIGLIAEDILTQVYETFFRNQLTKGLTLGQLADEIVVGVDSRFSKKTEDSPPDFSYLYNEIRDALESGENPNAALEKLRKLISTIIVNNKYFDSKIENLGKVLQRNTIFPERVGRSINELIKFRNASSHKSRIPIGPYEATRSIHSLIIFITWWVDEKRSIDWEKSVDDIIRESVARNTKI